MINQCTFIGRLGNDPEVRYSAQGTAFANFSIACSENWKDKNTGEKKEHTEWIRVVASAGLAEVCGQYLKKGLLVYVSGKMHTKKWQDQSGNDRFSTEIRIREMKMLSPRNDDSQVGGQQQVSHNAPQRTARETPQSNQFDYDDDIPF